DRRGVHLHGDAEAALEGPHLDFHRVVVPLALAPGGAFTRDREDALVVLDAEVLGFHPRNVHVDHELGVGLVDVRARFPLGGGDEADGAPVGDLVEIDVQLVGEVYREAAGAARGAVGAATEGAAVSHGSEDNARGGRARGDGGHIITALPYTWSTRAPRHSRWTWIGTSTGRSRPAGRSPPP